MIQLTQAELQSINGRVVNLTQAMLGFITPNFRAVSIEILPSAVNLHFLLEHESAADAEEIDNILFEYSVYEDGFPDPRAVAKFIVVSSGETELLAMPGMRVFGRKE